MGRARMRWICGGAFVGSLALAVAVVGSCNPSDESPSCGPGNCAGCCLIDGCVNGDIPEACGTGGAACTVCGAGQLCSAGTCTDGPVCGNGTLETGEQCDDGNTAPGDGCDAACLVEAADADADAVEDADTAEVETCGDYPAGPYAFARVGDTLAPMRWSAARTGIDEELAAELRIIRCAPGVKSIFLMVVQTTCSVCPGRLREIAALRDQLQTYGAKFIFLVTDASTSPMANNYIERYGVTFGWRSNDQDNSEGRFTIGEATAFVPWIAVVDATDMTIRYMESPSTAQIDVEAVARTLAEE
jgi:cysteine-rich repeat protein